MGKLDFLARVSANKDAVIAKKSVSIENLRSLLSTSEAKYEHVVRFLHRVLNQDIVVNGPEWVEWREFCEDFDADGNFSDPAPTDQDEEDLMQSSSVNTVVSSQPDHHTAPTPSAVPDIVATPSAAPNPGGLSSTLTASHQSAPATTAIKSSSIGPSEQLTPAATTTTTTTTTTSVIDSGRLSTSTISRTPTLNHSQTHVKSLLSTAAQDFLARAVAAAAIHNPVHTASVPMIASATASNYTDLATIAIAKQLKTEPKKAQEKEFVLVFESTEDDDIELAAEM
jgi:hypothetical protein